MIITIEPPTLEDILAQDEMLVPTIEDVLLDALIAYRDSIYAQKYIKHQRDGVSISIREATPTLVHTNGDKP